MFWQCSLSNGNEILISNSDWQFIAIAMNPLAMAMKNFMIIYIYIQGSTYFFEKLLWKVILSQPYFGWIGMKTWPNKISLHIGKCICHSCWKQIHCLKLYILRPKKYLLLFKFSNNNRIKCEICSKLTIEATDVILVASLLTFNIVDVTEAYVQGGTEVQVVYPTDLYLSTVSLQFEQSVINICAKIYNVDKNYKDLVWCIFCW